MGGMAAGLMQQGSAGAMRDLDYINPRPPRASCALPPEVRAKLKLGSGARSNSAPPPEIDSNIYVGAANAEPKVGASGAGTKWHNPNGHAFVKKGSGVPMSQRAARKSSFQQAGAAMLAGSREPSHERGLPPALPSGGRSASKDAALLHSRVPSQERFAPPRPPLK